MTPPNKSTLDIDLYRLVEKVAVHQTDVALRKRSSGSLLRVYYINPDGCTYRFLSHNDEKTALAHFITLSHRAVCMVRDGRVLRHNFVLD